jgi:PAS domain S-box-containing protein
MINGYNEKLAKARFSGVVDDTRTLIKGRMQDYEQALRGGVALADSLGRLPSRQEWQQYVKSLRIQENYPGVQGYGLAVMVRPKKLPTHIASIRNEGFRDYEVYPGGDREMYSAIIYLEPFDWRNQRAFGYDMYSNPVRREAMQRAALSGDSAASGRVTLVQETDEAPQAGFLLYLPFYRPNSSLATEAQRQEALLGFVYSPFRMGDLMHGLISSTDAPVNFEIYDEGDESKLNRLMFSNHRLSPSVYNAGFKQSRVIRFAGRSWVVDFSSTAEFDKSTISYPLRALAIASLIVAFLIFSILQLLTRQRDRVEARALEITRDLRAATDQLRLSASVFEHSREGIVITGPDAIILSVNKAFTELTGYSPDYAIGKTPAILRSGQHDDKFYQTLWHDLETEGYWRGEICNRKKDGSLFYELQTISAVPDTHGNTAHYVSVFTDITLLKAQENQLRHNANYDLLTGLPNRRLLTEQMQKMLALAKRKQFAIAIFYMDLDNFKSVNDHNDHSYGDALLVQVA